MTDAIILSVIADGADFTGADLTAAILHEVSLTGANFTDANLTGAAMNYVVLDGATWSNTICPTGANSDAVGGTCVNDLL